MPLAEVPCQQGVLCHITFNYEFCVFLLQIQQPEQVPLLPFWVATRRRHILSVPCSHTHSAVVVHWLRCLLKAAEVLKNFRKSQGAVEGTWVSVLGILQARGLH